MAIYNGYPATYPQQYFSQYIPQMQNQAPQPNGTGSIIWVQGEAGAKSYLVAPNTTVQLWDSESQTIYLKSADASGMPTMKIIDYTIRENSQQSPAIAREDIEPADYVTHKELLALENRIKKQISKLAPKEEVEEDE